MSANSEARKRAEEAAAGGDPALWWCIVHGAFDGECIEFGEHEVIPCSCQPVWAELRRVGTNLNPDCLAHRRPSGA